MIPRSAGNDKVKTKTKAVVSAIFFGFATWVYTYKADAKKFWIALLLSLGLGILTIAVAIDLLDAFIKWTETLISSGSGENDLTQIIKGRWPVLLLVALSWKGLWLWPLIDVIKKPDDWYEHYAGHYG